MRLLDLPKLLLALRGTPQPQAGRSAGSDPSGCYDRDVLSHVLGSLLLWKLGLKVSAAESSLSPGTLLAKECPRTSPGTGETDDPLQAMPGVQGSNHLNPRK